MEVRTKNAGVDAQHNSGGGGVHYSGEQVNPLLRGGIWPHTQHLPAGCKAHHPSTMTLPPATSPCCTMQRLSQRHDLAASVEGKESMWPINHLSLLPWTL